jgi:hypothetical protein
MAFLLNVVLAFTQSIPEFDCLVSATTDDLPVVRRKGDRKDVGSVANESTGGITSIQVPKTQSVIPRCRQGIHAIRRDSNVGHEVVVAMEDSFWCAIVTHFVTFQCPHDNSLI